LQEVSSKKDPGGVSVGGTSFLDSERSQLGGRGEDLQLAKEKELRLHKSSDAGKKIEENLKGLE